MAKATVQTPSTGLPGRKAQAARNDELILHAARAVFLGDPNAGIAAVAERAGVGIGAIYRRYASKEILLRTLCHQGLRRYIVEAEAALEDPDPGRALVEFLERVVDADVHSLTVHLAGTFTPDDSIEPDVTRSSDLNEQIVRRARESGSVRADVTAEDLGLVLEACAAVITPDPVRTRQLRRRVLTLLTDGLSVSGMLPGPPPTGSDFAWRWQPRS
jgi:AcrR family transcriptional regulator